MKNLKKVLALVLAVVMIMSVVTVASAKDYTDVKATDDYADAIDALSSLNILDGFKDGDNYSFKADGTFTRAQAAKIVAIVHNAATNGAIKGQDAISALYSNAQNPFVDCNTSWALPFINYCRITGLADGMTATTYEPNRYVTGVQFLKLMLTTLNFDTAKEGYTGTGWDVNVLNRANEIGLTAGLKDGWKAIAPIKRGEAAQILYNALTKYLVEYGQLVKNNYVASTAFAAGKEGYYKSSFISNEQVAQSGYTLGGKMGITIKRATDKFRRPGYSWSYGTWSAFYMDAPIAEYKEAVTECDILKAMGVSETSGKSVDLFTWKDAKDHSKGVVWSKTISYIKDGKVATDDNFSILNYFAVDGFKFDGNGTNYNAITLKHDDQKNCKKIQKYDWINTLFGGQGDLTQVFKTEDGYVITVVHTFLANVDAVKTVNRKTLHTVGASSDLTVYLRLNNDVPAYVETGATIPQSASTTAYAKDTKVLTEISLKKDELTNYANYVVGKAAVVSAAETKTGKLTGASDLAYAESVSIDGTKYPAACRFVMGKEKAMNFDHYKTVYTFYFDAYGNVIGCGNDATALQYVVMDKVWGTTEDGTFVVKANLHDLEGNALDKVTVSTKAGDFKDTSDGVLATGENFLTGRKLLSDNAKKNDANLTNALYSYTVDDKGVYTLNWVGEPIAAWVNGTGFSRFDSYDSTAASYQTEAKYFEHIAKRASILGVQDDAQGAGTNRILVNLTESTKVICKGVDGTYKTYTGYTALPALTARYVDYIAEEANSNFAAVLYLGEVAYAGDKVVGFVPEWSAFRWSQGYDVISVYVNGEEVLLNLVHKYQNVDERLSQGIYEFRTAVDADGVTYVTWHDAGYDHYQGVAKIGKDSSAVVIVPAPGQDATTFPAVGLTGVKIYLVADKTVKEITKEEILDNDTVIIYTEHNSDEITAIYVIDDNPGRP